MQFHDSLVMRIGGNLPMADDFSRQFQIFDMGGVVGWATAEDETRLFHALSVPAEF